MPSGNGVRRGGVTDLVPRRLLAAPGTALATAGLASALAFALPTGVLFGANAGLTKLVADQLARGWTEPLRRWPLYAMAATGPGGFLLSRRAFRSGGCSPR
jgi:hypothetical protein